MPAPTTSPQTLYDKVYNDHLVNSEGQALIYIDRHLVHEVTSPQAFEGLRNAGRKVRRPDCTLATVDHNIPTIPRASFKSIDSFITEPSSRLQVAALESNVVEFGLTYFGMGDRRQGIVHIIGPEQGFTLPGTTVVCGDSHTSTHGAFGALAFGIGTSEVEHVLATQTLPQTKSKNMRINVEGDLPSGCNSKDIVLHIIGLIGTAGGNGCVIEFSGSTIRALSMEARMSICNMSIEGGARAGMIAPDEITFEYLQGRPLCPVGDDWQKAVEYWKTLRSDVGAHYDVEVEIKAEDIPPTITWGTSPQDTVPINGRVPDPSAATDPIRKSGMQRSLEYMGLTAGEEMEKVKIDKAFLGSCTNGRIEDLRSAAQVVLAAGKDAQVAEGIYAMVVPGSGLVKQQAEAEGLDVVFKRAGFDWREAGCSMCLGMNPDQLQPKERCASTSNRNFEGRQGAGGRTHLMSPAMVAAAAMTGYLTDVRKFVGEKVSEHPEMKITSVFDFLDPAVASPAPIPRVKTEIVDTDAKALPEATDPSAAGLPKFNVLTGIAAPMSTANIDTDMIIPKQFLKTLERTGLGKFAFFEHRYDAKTGEENKAFVLNQEPYRGANILVCTGANFGCGSSREHAPWAINDFGIRCVMAPSFADIFYNNCFKNGMLPIVLPESELEVLHADASAGDQLTVDLSRKVIVRPHGKGEISFNVDDFRRHCLINGLDDIGLTLQHKEKIESFESKRTTVWPWLDGLGYHKKGGKVPVKPASPVKKAKMDW